MDDVREIERLEAVHRFLQIDFNRNAEFQQIVDLLAEVCDKPVALITLLDQQMNWLKVKTGFDGDVMPRETSFCQYGIEQDELLIIPDASKDSRFDHNPLVQDAPGVRFYAGAPLIIKGELRLGTLCLFDVKPAIMSPMQQKILKVLSRQVSFLMELELSQKLMEAHISEIEAKNALLGKIAHIQSHDIRQPLTSIMGLISSIKDDNYAVDKDRLKMIEEAAHDLDDKVHAIVGLTGRSATNAAA